MLTLMEAADMLGPEARVSGQAADMFEGVDRISGVVYMLLLR